MNESPLCFVTDPFRDACRQVAGVEPPEWVKGWGIQDLPDEDYIHMLQCWFLNEGDGPFSTEWGTGIGALEAAEHIVECAIENGNIWTDDDPRWNKNYPGMTPNRPRVVHRYPKKS